MHDACPAIPGVMNQVYDCGSDDYFNAAPAPGTYLATRLERLRQPFLGRCAEIAPACGGDAGEVPEPPVSTAAPRIQGDAYVGGTLDRDQRHAGSTTRLVHRHLGAAVADGWAEIPGATGWRFRRRAAR